ncbi:hypothetical protein ACWOBP_00180 [Gemella parahaemolysans]
MKKSFNYISYCIYSFMPLYFVLLIYTFVKQDLDALILTTILTIISIFFLIIQNASKPTNIFVCEKKEIFKQKGIDYYYLVLVIIITFLIINQKVQLIFKITILVFIFYLLFCTMLSYKNYALTLLGYKIYTIRDKIVYSKKSQEELYKVLKDKKSLQILEVSNNIYIENEKYSMTNFYCKDF